jgi:cytochrome c-type biogenesis protein CcmH
VSHRVLAASLAAILLALGAAEHTGAATPPRASLPDLEDEVMCPVCGEPLSVADSPQATRERRFIRRLITRGYDKQQIKAALVREFGPAVLAEPEPTGFDAAAYLVPPAAALLVLLPLAILVVRRGRRAPTHPEPTPATPVVTDAENRRLDEDLRRSG